MPGPAAQPQARASTASTTAFRLACAALGLALIAVPGGLVWLTVWIPALGVPNDGVLAVLADLVTIPAAVTSWALASASAITATLVLLGRRRARRAAVALTLSAPGAVLGIVAMVSVAIWLGTSLGVLPGGADARRDDAARAVAVDLRVPTSGPTFIDRCEFEDGVFDERRTITVLERWSQRRVDQIRGDLLHYTTRTSDGPSASSDRELDFSGYDDRGNLITVVVDSIPAGQTSALGCRQVRVDERSLRTSVSVSRN